LQDHTKYEMLLNDLSSVETQASVLVNKCKDMMERNLELEDFANKAKKEINMLSQKIVNLESELEKVRTERDGEEGKLSYLLNTKETETLKIKLQNLISRIDYHLSSDR
jgi:predicted  nucleic acid-binding Zn-ribbon protein